MKPILETGRILLRPLKLTDAETIFQNWTSDSDVVRYMSYSPHQSVDETIEWLAVEEKNIAKDTSYTWGYVLKETGELFGSGGIYYSEDLERFELGYNLMKKYWSRGLATEAARAIIDFARNELGINSFFCKHAKDNAASAKVIEKLGFVYQKDGTYTSLDGKRAFDCREYLLTITNPPR